MESVVADDKPCAARHERHVFEHRAVCKSAFAYFLNRVGDFDCRQTDIVGKRSLAYLHHVAARLENYFGQSVVLICEGKSVFAYGKLGGEQSALEGYAFEVVAAVKRVFTD